MLSLSDVIVGFSVTEHCVVCYHDTCSPFLDWFNRHVDMLATLLVVRQFLSNLRHRGQI